MGPLISRVLAGTFAALIVAACATKPAPPPAPPPTPAPPMMPPTVPLSLRLGQVSFADLKGWAASDPKAALEAFRRSCVALSTRPDTAPLGGVNYAGSAGDWRPLCLAASAIPSEDAQTVRGFFEAEFVPYRVTQSSGVGLFTGYYEPQLKGSRTQHGRYQTPLYGTPADLVNVDLGLFRDTLKGQRIVGQVANGRLVPYPARAAIESNGLAQAKPLLFVDNPIDAFFLQIQGSGRVVLDDGSVVRAAYAAQNGRAYTAIGAVLIQRGELKREEVSMQSIRAWLSAHPEEAPQIMNANASYVFFTEQALGDPILGAAGAQGVPLTPEASLAVDLSLHALGIPVWLEMMTPDPDPTMPDRAFERLLIMQDTGGAIRGPVRGDVYWGYSTDAASIAGRMRSEGTMTVFLPKTVAAQLGPSAEFAAGPR
jgi:membrane-bound lytic murein transglycosylase A